LRVTSIVTQSPNFSGEKTTIQWTVTNFGETIWSGTRYWTDDVYFSRYATFDKPEKLGSFTYSNDHPLASGDSYTQTGIVTLPRGIGGTADNPQTFYIRIVTNPNGGLTASTLNNDAGRSFFASSAYEDPSNNIGNGLLTVIYREPDLRVTNLVVPSTTPHSGGTIPVTWTVTNVGNRDTREGYWIDRVYLSRDPSLDYNDTEVGEIGHYTVLKTGDAYTITANVPLPDGIGGNFYVLVFTDSNIRGAVDVSHVSGDGSDPFLARVGEYQGEGNNITSAFMPVILSTPPDLQVTAVNAQGHVTSQPTHILTGSLFDVSYTVSNLGAGPTPPRQNTWRDQIYLSRDQFLDRNTDRYLGEVSHTGGLNPADSYQNTV
jgi:hypothetical protein